MQSRYRADGCRAWNRVSFVWRSTFGVEGSMITASWSSSVPLHDAKRSPSMNVEGSDRSIGAFVAEPAQFGRRTTPGAS